MDDIFKLFYYGIGAIIFAVAITILISYDGIMDKEYDYVLHRNMYSEFVDLSVE